MCSLRPPISTSTPGAEPDGRDCAVSWPARKRPTIARNATADSASTLRTVHSLRTRGPRPFDALHGWLVGLIEPTIARRVARVTVDTAVDAVTRPSPARSQGRNRLAPLSRAQAR